MKKRFSGAVERLAHAIKIPSISNDGEHVEPEFVEYFHALVKESFPLIWSMSYRQVINNGSLLFTIHGENPNTIMLLGHFDVVPVPNRERWRHDPFSGYIDDNGYLWGRGTLDFKQGAMGILEATEEYLRNLETGSKPKKTIILAIGHDEEIFGFKGAKVMAETLESWNIKPEFILDEGGFVIQPGILPGVKVPLATIGTTERGSATYSVTVRSDGGHSSLGDGVLNPIEFLSQGIIKLQEMKLPMDMNDSTRAFLKTLGKLNPLMKLARLPTLGEKILKKGPKTKAMILPTIVPTVIQGGEKQNSVPSEVSLTINVRLTPGWSPRRFQDFLDDVFSEAEIKILEGWSSPSISPGRGDEYFDLIANTAKDLFGAVPTEFLGLAGSDSRWYETICNNIYRFSPVRVNAQQLASIHGIDEKIHVDDYLKSIEFYYELIDRFQIKKIKTKK